MTSVELVASLRAAERYDARRMRDCMRDLRASVGDMVRSRTEMALQWKQVRLTTDRMTERLERDLNRWGPGVTIGEVAR